MLFAVKAIIFSVIFHWTFVKIYFLIIPIFLISFCKIIYNTPGNRDTERYPEPSQTSEMELFAKIVHRF